MQVGNALQQPVLRKIIDEAAAAFYEHHGFVAVPGNRQRLVQKVNDIAAALGR